MTTGRIITDHLHNKWPPTMSEIYIRTNSTSSRLASVPKPVLWGSCQVCGDNGTGKHYGVIACEGCKGFFKRSVRKNLVYSCRGHNDCIIDKMHRNRCQKCRFVKCLKAGMKREAVQCERKPLLVATHAYTLNQSTLPCPEEKEDRGYASESGSEHCLTPPLSVTSPGLPAHQQAIEFLGPHHTEFRVNIPSLGGIARLSMDYIYEFATRLLFVSVEWTQSLAAFRSLHKADQIALLRKTWSDIFLLGVAQCITHFPFSPLLTLAARDLQTRGGDEASDVKPSTHLPGQISLFDKIIAIKDLMFSFEKLDLDATEFAYLKAVVLFNSDPYTSVQDKKQVDLLQEQSHCGLKAYLDSKHPNNPGRFAKILLRLPAVRLIDKSAVEELFFAPLIGTVKIGNIMENILTRSSANAF